jgi:acetyl esterase/lipase
VFVKYDPGNLLVVCALLSGLSLLAVFQAPIEFFWYAALVVTEWGHYVAILCLGLVIYLCLPSRRFMGLALMTFCAGFLYMSPLVRALPIARELPSELATHFGPAQMVSTPLNLKTLYLGTPKARAAHKTYTYATHHGLELKLDVFEPLRKTIETRPCVIVVHGGSWQTGDRSEFQAFSQHLAVRGYTVASIDYRLAPVAVAPTQEQDVRDAIRYLKRNAKKFGIDPQNLVLLGRSAGGQIVLSVAYKQRDPAIRGVIALYAPSDLVWGYANPSNPLIMDSCLVIDTYLGTRSKAQAGLYEAASPLYFVGPATPPTLMIHGERDELVSPLHNVRLSEKLSKFKRPHYFVRMPWATHGCDINLSGPCGQISTYAIEYFLTALR